MLAGKNNKCSTLGFCHISCIPSFALIFLFIPQRDIENRNGFAISSHLHKFLLKENKKLKHIFFFLLYCTYNVLFLPQKKVVKKILSFILQFSRNEDVKNGHEFESPMQDHNRPLNVYRPTYVFISN